jgi:hypothetical protein
MRDLKAVQSDHLRPPPRDLDVNERPNEGPVAKPVAPFDPILAYSCFCPPF